MLKGVENLCYWGIPFSVRFRRLFYLAVEKSCSVLAMFSLGWEDGCAAWRWKRKLWVWEEELLVECRTLLQSVSLQSNVTDQWQLDSIKGYSVRDVYKFLTALESIQVVSEADLIWHKHVPLKVSIFAWRLLGDRLPTKSNMVSRSILYTEASLCTTCCSHVDNLQHLFFSCSTFGSLWHHVRLWIDISRVDPQVLPDHFIQFTYASDGLKVRRSFLQLVWLLCVWLVWNERNNRLSKNIESSIPQLFDKVKYYSLWWLEANNANFVPFMCLGID